MAEQKHFFTPNILNMVAHFHRTFNHPILPEPTIPSDERVRLRLSLLLEELEELTAACEKGDIVEAADAFADLQYVLAGAILEFGLGEKFLAIFHEVQESNMSKACDSEEEATATIEKYAKDGVSAYSKKDGNKWLVYRTIDDKTLKSINYKPADIKRVLDYKL